MSKKQKLSADQKRWLENLIWYTKNVMSWELEEEELREVVECGNHAVFCKRPDFYNEEKAETIFGAKMVIGASDLCGAELIVKYNCCEFYHVVDLNFLMPVLEVKKLVKPSFKVWVDKMESKNERKEGLDLARNG